MFDIDREVDLFVFEVVTKKTRRCSFVLFQLHKNIFCRNVGNYSGGITVSSISKRCLLSIFYLYKEQIRKLIVQAMMIKRRIRYCRAIGRRQFH